MFFVYICDVVVRLSLCFCCPCLRWISSHLRETSAEVLCGFMGCVTARHFFLLILFVNWFQENCHNGPANRTRGLILFPSFVQCCASLFICFTNPRFNLSSFILALHACRQCFAITLAITTNLFSLYDSANATEILPAPWPSG